MTDQTTSPLGGGFTDKPIEGADWTDREMWTAIAELMEPATTVTTHLRTNGRGTVLRATCTLDGCGHRTNPRLGEDDVARDMIRHACDAHAAQVRKRIRDVQRRAHLEVQPDREADHG